ncbi:MAG TPA: autotransporter assembly complex family protein [Syntrophorhabdaceae bacterium]|nr:autotransporter assembly complex family protein [Syntrophorhabdaceae bacterium]
MKQPFIDFRIIIVGSGLIILLFLSTVCCAAESEIRIAIQGVTGQELENVELALTLPAGVVRDSTVDQRWLDLFVKQIPEKTRKALEPFGYYNPSVTVTPVHRDGSMGEIHVSIEAGSPVRINKIEVTVTGPGENEKELVDLVKSFPLHAGDTLLHDVYERAKKDIFDKAISLGYLDSAFSVHTITVTPEQLSADIVLSLNTGHLYYFGDTVFTGAPEYPRSFFSRFVEFKKGDVFSYEKIGLTQRNLINSNRLDSVVIDSEKETARDYRIPVQIRLTASKPKRLKFGFGYQTDVGPKLAVEYQNVNVFGTGHAFDSRMDLSLPKPEATLRYTIPSTKDIKSLTAFKLNFRREDQQDVFTEALIAEIERVRSIGKFMTGSVFLQTLKERSDAGDEKTNTFSLLPGVRFSGSSYDDTIRPTRGYRFAVELKGTHQVLGSDTGLIQIIADGGLMIPLPARFTILTRARLGATAQNEERGNLPIALRFFAGGDQSVRGYGYKKLGPQDDRGDVVGGKHTLVASLELERAVGADWGVAAFYDIGNAFNDFANLQLAKGAGLGVRYYSPIGPIKIDVARQIGVKNPKFRLHISIGFGL